MLFINTKVRETDLNSILLKHQNDNLFSNNYLPEIDIMDNNEIYIHTNKYIYSTTGSYHYKFLVFDELGNLITDVKYNYTLLPQKGFLMKIRIPVNNPKVYNIEYVIQLDQVECQLNVSQKKNTTDICEEIQFISIDYQTKLNKTFVAEMNVAETFFDKYLKYDI